MAVPRILVVDDEPLNLAILTEFLEDENYELVTRGNGESAWTVLNETGQVFDLVILDRMMPQLDGLSLLKRIKGEERFRTMPVIMQTAAAAPEQVREGLQAGAYYYLTKPYEPEALLAIVREALRFLREESSLSELARTHSAAERLITRAECRFGTLEEASVLALYLSSLCPEPERVNVGMTELLINAVEHGNLGIDYAEKTRLKLEDAWELEVQRRLSVPEYAGRRATVLFERGAEELVFTVSDEGGGFDWRRYLEFEPERAFDPNGRGIAMARNFSFDRLEYRGPGNVVVASVRLI